MPPNQKNYSLTEGDNYVEEKKNDDSEKKENTLSTKFTQQPIIWLNTISIILFHVVSIVSFFVCIHRVKFLTIIWGEYQFIFF